MPYIKQSEYKRARLAPRTPGELNFDITRSAVEYIKRKGLTYATLNEVIGALESAKLEFYRRAVVPYENEARERNGDVY